MSKTTINIKRIYDHPSSADGYRVLVDRVWPRGIKKAEAALDLWAKELAPSTPLRKWFNHEAEKWAEFQTRYQQELREKQDILQEVLAKAHHKPLTLLYSAKDTQHNNALVLQHYLTTFARKSK